MLHIQMRTVIGLSVIGLTAMVAACTVGATAQSQQIITNLQTIANTSTADLNGVIAVANAATPPAPHLAACATATLTVGAAMQKVLAATPAATAATPGATVGVFTVAAVASLYEPGSAQFTWATETIQTGCIAEYQDVMNAGATIAGLPAAMAAALAIAVPKG
jgi:hypothetical protein